ncbi:MAG: toll/interleukin-1 receptor domain-containing protein [Nitrosarchaeum sp.]|nr:toll/interleukin-1 receptor domain-containing protein [Nitrosarchaeum sp.]
MTIKIFLSHSDKDKKIASDLKSKLSKHGLSVFLAHEDIDGGSDWVSKLYEEIQNCKIFIMLLSKNYHLSNYTEQEAGIALNCSKTILPVSIDGTKPNGFVSSLQAFPCSVPFKDPKIDEIVRICKLDNTSKTSELDKLLSQLEKSGSYTESATLAPKLKKHVFSESQLRRLVYSVLSNPQVSYSWVADGIINEIIGEYLDKVDPVFGRELEKFHDPSHPPYSSYEPW